MSNVIQFPSRPKPAPAPETAAVEAPASGAVPAAVEEMVKSSAAVQLIATLQFYASQGFDHGGRARAAMPALRELLATKGFNLAPS